MRSFPTLGFPELGRRSFGDGIQPGSIQVPSGGVITPDMFAGLTSWLDASNAGQMFTDNPGTINVSADGQAVAFFDDLSPIGNNYIQNTLGFRPLYKTNRQNGKSGLLFQGTDDLMTSNIYTSFYSLAARTSIMVLNIISAANGLWGDASGYSGVYVAAPDAVRFYNYDGINDIVDVDPQSGAVVISTWHDSGNIYIQRNNATIGGPVASGNIALANLAQQIGSTAGLFGNFDLYEMATYNVGLSTVDRGLLVTALKNKWGIL